MHWKLNKQLALIAVGLLVPLISWAQPKDNSPITRYGIGDVYRGDFNQTGATGGLYGAWTDYYRVNPGNPACLPYLQTTSLEFGLYSRYNQYERNGSQQAVWSGNLDYLSLAFPLKSRINEILDKKETPWDYAMGFSVNPISQVGYDVELTQDIEGVDTVRSIFTGEGGGVGVGGGEEKDRKLTSSFGFEKIAPTKRTLKITKIKPPRKILFFIP